MASSSSYNSPCAACKFLRRKCLPSCIFAPCFPPDEPQKFANVHKIFGASNVAKLLNDLLPHHREDAVNSLAYEAEARIRDPVYGCVGAVVHLQRQVQKLQKELDEANADLWRYACSEIHQTVAGVSLLPPPSPVGPRSTEALPLPHQRPPSFEYSAGSNLISEAVVEGEWAHYSPPPLQLPNYALPQNDNPSGN